MGNKLETHWSMKRWKEIKKGQSGKYNRTKWENSNLSLQDRKPKRWAYKYQISMIQVILRKDKPVDMLQDHSYIRRE